MKERKKHIQKKRKKNTDKTKHIFSERCGPIGAAISPPVGPCDVDAPQPLVDRRPSVSMLKWGSYHKRNDTLSPAAARQGLIYHVINGSNIYIYKYYYTPTYII